MRTITAGLFSAADGVVAEPQDWHFPYFNDELGVAVMEQLGAAKTVLFGRTTYEGFAAAWPAREAAGQDLEMAEALGDARKIVVSHQKLDLTWRNSEQVEGDLLDFVRELKAGDGGPIGVSGSVSVVRQLLRAGLLDELHLFVHPIALGQGLRIWQDDLAEPIKLRLIKCDVFKTGTLHVVYGPAEDAA
ncbi:dihydrofolate reductase family protein [Catenulispora sp. NF23]|uniref:dihydrofolate reductase family protein n=1 Tax=Catenulispora pinistramenti TaxID=2705254 RepID=UPI001BA5B059|nr:dihydrofolate reductase family protein [Catenulispora pinistramenti]MBS2532076.1 dihydrofolate reductase family protein [Catenulispora pinistramenti]